MYNHQMEGFISYVPTHEVKIMVNEEKNMVFHAKKRITFFF